MLSAGFFIGMKENVVRLKFQCLKTEILKNINIYSRN